MAKLITLFGGETPEIQYFDSREKALKELDRFVKDSIKKGHRVEKQVSRPDAYEIETLLGDIYIYVEDDKVSAKTINNQVNIINNQNQRTMPTKKQFKTVPYDPSKKDKNGRVIGNPYRLTSGGKNYQAVPERMVTLPKGNAFIIAKKHVNLGGEYNNQATYVLGYSNLSGHRQNGKVRRHYFVARLIYRGGNPALALYRYSGYDLQLAKDVFSEIAYDKAEYQGRDGKFYPYRKASMTSQEVVAAKVRKQEALERMKTAAYGSKEERRAYAQKNKRRYPRVAK